MYRNQPITITIYTALPAYVIAALLQACEEKKQNLGEHVAELLQFHVDLAAAESAAMDRLNKGLMQPLITDEPPFDTGPTTFNEQPLPEVKS